ncbi:hypothetical protein ACH5RR_029558 [Cinchona calisaya]|uniref:Uncharacterized protein n=1 Tax=Cinchona calisaya TaxID=153742 RepID=A0ABD2YVA6_9GENT
MDKESVAQLKQQWLPKQTPATNSKEFGLVELRTTYSQAPMELSSTPFARVKVISSQNPNPSLGETRLSNRQSGFVILHADGNNWAIKFLKPRVCAAGDKVDVVEKINAEKCVHAAHINLHRPCIRGG